MSEAPAPPTCSQCGAVPVGGAPPLDWMLDVDGFTHRWVCPACARRHARAIEGKLDQAWW